MNQQNKMPHTGDPSNVIQHFPKYQIQLLCCRHWWLEKWEFKELSFPYWRIYHNSSSGAVIIYNGKEYQLASNKVIMIPPNTSYATRLYNNRIPKAGYSLKGGRVNTNFSEETLHLDQYILHLFIHFNIGIPYDTFHPGIFCFDLTDHLLEKLQKIKRHLNYENAKFSFPISLALKSLITDLLAELPEESWNILTKNHRILESFNFIEQNINKDLNNSVLAENANMSTNAFIHLFSSETGMSPQKYIRQKRINQACILLHHSSFTIDQIAYKTGFANRYHFSKIFKEVSGLSPARYKKVLA
ncbi:AraC family transcriptional regulator [uncultured Draconibacterium sp.]|uniref:helix-turn-helix domain-containing protein n=1 Tax=uncultured Draconibacterium sp. TaxID=1573823 RepID=UPI0029C78F5D|nr:AraC family transcriptional regulator [uncultured Draconibacterium sp.]